MALAKIPPYDGDRISTVGAHAAVYGSSMVERLVARTQTGTRDVAGNAIARRYRKNDRWLAAPRSSRALQFLPPPFELVVREFAAGVPLPEDGQRPFVAFVRASVEIRVDEKQRHA